MLTEFQVGSKVISAGWFRRCKIFHVLTRAVIAKRRPLVAWVVVWAVAWAAVWVAHVVLDAVVPPVLDRSAISMALAIFDSSSNANWFRCGGRGHYARSVPQPPRTTPY